MAGQRLHLASLATQKVESVPGSSKPTLVHLRPDQLVPTPLNPRRDFNKEKLQELGNSMRGGQLQPCVGIARSAYVRLFPEHADRVPDCRVVMAAGERRWRAAMQVGLPALDVHIREDIAESRLKFLSAVLTENVERSNFNYIEEAHGLAQMLEMSEGNQTQAAAALSKSKQWFSQRIGILRLSEEMQELVITGRLTAFRDMRKYAALPPEQQRAAWEADQQLAEEKRLAPKPAREAKDAAPNPASVAQRRQPDNGGTLSESPAAEPPVYTAVYTPPSADPAWAPRNDMPPPAEPSADTVLPDQRAEAEGPVGTSPATVAERPDKGGLPGQPPAKPPIKMPWEDGLRVAEIAIEKMDITEMSRLYERIGLELERISNAPAL